MDQPGTQERSLSPRRSPHGSTSVAAVRVLVAAVALCGCDRRPTCSTFEPHEGFANHVQPFEVAVDEEARRAYSTSLASRTVAVIDVDSRTLIGSVPVASRPLVYPDITVDERGTSTHSNVGRTTTSPCTGWSVPIPIATVI